MNNPLDTITDKLEARLAEFGERLRRRIIAESLEIVADVLAAEPTTPTVLRAKAKTMREEK